MNKTRTTRATIYKRIAWVHTPWGLRLYPGPWESWDLLTDGQATQIQKKAVWLN